MQAAVSSGVMEMDRFSDQVRRGVTRPPSAHHPQRGGGIGPELDAIALGNRDPTAYLSAFYIGEQGPGLREQVKQATQSVDARAVCSIPVPRADGDVAGAVELS
mgnify:CR=1 FL=1